MDLNTGSWPIAKSIDLEPSLNRFLSILVQIRSNFLQPPRFEPIPEYFAHSKMEM
ncbi:hypothetical protein C4J86_3148 [Pseudomonas sp. R2-7-07]|nr:hypothetical protein C4J86_3148 [Pseudomonas sp. R2-7-07]